MSPSLLAEGRSIKRDKKGSFGRRNTMADAAELMSMSVVASDSSRFYLGRTRSRRRCNGYKPFLSYSETMTGKG